MILSPERGRSIKVAMHPLSATGVSPRIGFLVLEDTPRGLAVRPELPDLRPYGVGPGEHGLHVHSQGRLEPGQGASGPVPGLMAGEHFDPQRTGHHRGPYANGHLGDLPRIKVDTDGVPRTAVLAPRLMLDQILGRSIILHEGPDNYTDDPPNGGGARRAVGGVITDDCPYCPGSKNSVLRDNLLMLGFGAVVLGITAYFHLTDEDIALERKVASIRSGR